MFTNFLSLTKLKVKIKLYSVLIMTAKTHSSVFFSKVGQVLIVKKIEGYRLIII